jgi:type IX secretion system PorP/SprF family membrane protein
MLIPSTRGRVGLGAYVINDVNAKVARTGLSFTYAYHIRLQNEQQLSFGLAIKGFQYRIDGDELTFGQPGDPVAEAAGRKVGYSPDADFGVYYTGMGYFAGFSVSNLFQSALVIGDIDADELEVRRHYWLTAGYNYRFNYYWSLEPTTLLKTSENWNPQGDFTVKLLYDNRFWGGISYRTNKSIIGLIGAMVDNVYFGYGFDWSFSEIGHHSYGSHEITLAIKMGDNRRKSRSQLRY